MDRSLWVGRCGLVTVDRSLWVGCYVLIAGGRLLFVTALFQLPASIVPSMSRVVGRWLCLLDVVVRVSGIATTIDQPFDLA